MIYPDDICCCLYVDAMSRISCGQGYGARTLLTISVRHCNSESHLTFFFFNRFQTDKAKSTLVIELTKRRESIVSWLLEQTLKSVRLPSPPETDASISNVESSVSSGHLVSIPHTRESDEREVIEVSCIYFWTGSSRKLSSQPCTRTWRDRETELSWVS